MQDLVDEQQHVRSLVSCACCCCGCCCKHRVCLHLLWLLLLVLLQEAMEAAGAGAGVSQDARLSAAVRCNLNSTGSRVCVFLQELVRRDSARRAALDDEKMKEHERELVGVCC